MSDRQLHQFPTEFDTLRTVEVFTGDRIGAVGMTPPHLTAWRRLLIHERADECFKQLIDSASLAGQLYGLAGVYCTDHASFAALAAPYKVHRGTVKTIFACFVGDTPVTEIVDQIASGALLAELRGSRGGA